MTFEKKNNYLFFAGVLLVCFSVSVGVRYQQFETWKKTPSAYFVGERPMMTTLDAPYWLRWAREFNEGVNLKKLGLQRYPDSSETIKKLREMAVPQKFKDPQQTFSTPSTSGTQEIHYSDVPLLSLVIAYLSPFFNHNYYLTGTLVIPFLASLFILPLGIYFFQIGLPVSGLLGGLIGTFASGYYMRSSIGRIDTDMLNLFFPLLAGLLILLASSAKSERKVMLFSVGTGLSLFLFQWWYEQAGFVLIYFMVLVFSLFIQQFRLRIILAGAFLFVLSCAKLSVYEAEKPSAPPPVPELSEGASSEEKRGFELYKVSGCVGCHSPPFTNAKHLAGDRDLPTIFGRFCDRSLWAS